MGSPRLHISTLGSFAAHSDGRPLPFERNKNKALLAFLCMNPGRIFTRDFLADLLWSGPDAQKSQHSLRQALYSIKRIAPQALIVSGSSVECDAEAVTTDMAETGELVRRGKIAEALKLIRGEVLADLSTSCGSDFDDWRSNTSREFFAGLDADMSHVLSQNPLFAVEQLHGTTISADLLPRTASALAHIRVDRNQRNFNGGSGPSVTTLPFVGRDQQIQQLTEAWAKCRLGAPQCVAIVGHPGYGKTRLAQEFLRVIAANRPLTFAINCYESEAKIGFSVASDLVRLLLGEADMSRLQQLWIDTVGEILPTGGIERRHAPLLTPSGAQIRLFESIRHILLDVARDRSVVVLVEDVQWCDRSSQALFAHLGHRLRDCQVFTLVTARERTLISNKDAPWSEWQNVFVPELTETDVENILEKSGLTPQHSSVSPRNLCRYSGGNPYFIAELLRTKMTGDVQTAAGRAPLKASRRSRLFLLQLIRELSPECQQCLVALAVIGRPVSMSVLKAVARVSAIEPAVTELLATGFAVSKRRELMLRHDLLRHSVYSQTPLLVRSELHARFAKIASRDPHRAGEAAQHYLKSGNRRLAHTYAVLAAEQADARYANQESIALLKVALKANPLAMKELSPLLIERLHRAHRYEEARAAIHRLGAFDNSEQSVPLELQVLELDLSREMGLINGSTLRARLEDLKGRPGAGRSDCQIAATRVQVRSAFHDADRTAMIAGATELRTLAKDADGPEGLEALALAARVHATVRSAFEARGWVAGLELNSIQEHECRLRTLSMIAAVEYECGLLDSARRMHELMLADIERIGAMSLWPLAACHLHMLLIETGEYAQAEALSEASAARANDVGGMRDLLSLPANRASMLFEMGDYAGTIVAAEAALGDMSWTTSVWIELGLRSLRGLSALELGKVKDAIETGRHIAETFARLGFRACDVSHSEMLLARIAVINKRPDAAIARLREAVADYAERDVVCRLRLQLELARTLKPVDRAEARRHAKEVYEKACAINARPLADRADSLLHRL